MTSRRSIHNEKNRNSPTPTTPQLNFHGLRSTNIEKYNEENFTTITNGHCCDHEIDDDDDNDDHEESENSDDTQDRNFQKSFSKTEYSSDEDEKLKKSTKISKSHTINVQCRNLEKFTDILDYLFHNRWAIILTIIIIGLTIFGTKKFHFDRDDIVQNPFQIFETKLNDMKKIYPNQDIKSWTKIKSAVRSFFEHPEKRDQSVIVLLLSYNDDHQSKLESFADSLIELFSATSLSKKNQSNLTIDVTNFQSPVDLMFQLGDIVEKFNAEKKEKFESIFYQIRSLEYLRGRAPLIFHNFCDDTKFKNSIFVLNLKCEKIFVHKNWDEMADECLKSIWLADESLDLDKISPLLSRIAVNVVLV